jgi:hypothetical protein
LNYPVVITQQTAARQRTLQAHDNKVSDEARSARKGEPEMATSESRTAAQQAPNPSPDGDQLSLSEIVTRGLDTMNRIAAKENNPTEGIGEGDIPGDQGPEAITTICLLLYAAW